MAAWSRTGRAEPGEPSYDGGAPADPARPEREADAASSVEASPAATAAGGEAAAEADLIERIAADRDRAAFQQIYDLYGGRLKAFMRRSGASPEEAEEAAQEALIAVWRKAATFDRNRATARAWMFAIARNKRIDLFRKAARVLPDPDDPALRPEPPRPPEAAVADDRRDAAVRAALDALSDEQRQVVVLSFYEARPHSEIAEALGIPLGTVKSRLRLAFKKIRDALGPVYRDDAF